MDTLIEYLDELEDILDSGRGRPFSGKITVEKEKIFDIIGEIRLNLPHEIRHAKKIIEDHDRIIEDANNKATAILAEAEQRAQEIASEHQIYELATEAAEKLVEEAKKYSREVRLGTMSYVEEILNRTETAVRETLNDMTQGFKAVEEELSDTINRIAENKQEIRGGRE